jgi:hypothetical protein
LVRDGHSSLRIICRWNIQERDVYVFTLGAASELERVRYFLGDFLFLFRRSSFDPGDLNVRHLNPPFDGWREMRAFPL